MGLRKPSFKTLGIILIFLHDYLDNSHSLQQKDQIELLLHVKHYKGSEIHDQSNMAWLDNT